MDKFNERPKIGTSGSNIYSLLDKPEILGVIFYPRKEWTPAPGGATDYIVPISNNISISCRFYPARRESPSILFFHGNGEVACDYDGIAPLYNKIDISLFVADYRGYGRSEGSPSFSAMLSDAHSIYSFFDQVLRERQFTGPVFVMGRSLGIHSAVELVTHYGQEIKGLIVESGAARMTRLLSRFGTLMEPGDVKQLESIIAARVRSIKIPTLIMHGERDSLIPSGEAVWFHEEVGVDNKRLVIIPRADHNDIMWVGMKQYLTAIKDFAHSLS